MGRFAAIDIGSNAIRTIIAETNELGHIAIIKKSRIALRLGEDVFSTGAISKDKEEKLLSALNEIKDQTQKLNVNRIKACATSAMREAHNGLIIKQLILQNTGIDIELIDGDQEAFLVHEAVQSELHLDKKLTIMVDIGGGSTEFTISENEKIISCKSFSIGAVRMLQIKNADELSSFINKNVNEALQFINSKVGNRKIEAMVGTGGNFRRLGKINRKLIGKTFLNYIPTHDLQNICQELQKLTHIERVKKFDLSDDRADVIVPAAVFIEKIANRLEVNGIYLPKVGLKEGILLSIEKKLM